MCRACLHRETCRFFSACRREIPRLSLRGESLRRWSCGARFTVLRVTMRIINGVTTSSDDIYIYIIECEMISIVESWDGGGGSIIYLILRDWKRRWNICGDQIKWWSKDTFYISTYMIFPRVTKIYSFIFKSIWEYSINYCKYYSCFFLYF